MKLIVRRVMLAFVIATPAAGQSLPTPEHAKPPTAPLTATWDVAGGINLVRMEPGPSLGRTGLIGWNASVAVFPAGRFGLAAEVAATQRTPSLSDTVVPDTQVRLHENTFLIGPAVRLLQRERLKTTSRVLIGVARVTGEFPSDVVQQGIAVDQTPASLGVFRNESAFAIGFGSTWDISLSPSVSVRMSPSLLFTRFGGETQRTQRISTGIVYRFGWRPRD